MQSIINVNNLLTQEISWDIIGAISITDLNNKIPILKTPPKELYKIKWHINLHIFNTSDIYSIGLANNGTNLEALISSNLYLAVVDFLEQDSVVGAETLFDFSFNNDEIKEAVFINSNYVIDCTYHKYTNETIVLLSMGSSHKPVEIYLDGEFDLYKALSQKEQNIISNDIKIVQQSSLGKTFKI